jgi:hypothetical protein
MLDMNIPHTPVHSPTPPTGKYSLHAAYHFLRENKPSSLLVAFSSAGRLVPDLGVGQSVGMRLTDQHAACLLFLFSRCSQTHPHSQAFQPAACLSPRLHRPSPERSLVAVSCHPRHGTQAMFTPGLFWASGAFLPMFPAGLPVCEYACVSCVPRYHGVIMTGMCVSRYAETTRRLTAILGSRFLGTEDYLGTWLRLGREILQVERIE